MNCNPTIDIINDEKIIYFGPRDEEFKKNIIKVLRLGKIKEHYIYYLLDDESMTIYDAVFTSKTANEIHNYEMYEQMGDGIIMSFLVLYMYRRFPELQCSESVKIVARLKINYGSKNSFFQIAEKLNFWNYITASDEKRSREKKALLEDTLEAFIGATAFILDKKIKMGVGYAIAYKILEEISEKVLTPEKPSDNMLIEEKHTERENRNNIMKNFLNKISKLKSKLHLKYSKSLKHKYNKQKNGIKTKINAKRTTVKRYLKAQQKRATLARSK